MALFINNTLTEMRVAAGEPIVFSYQPQDANGVAESLDGRAFVWSIYDDTRALHGQYSASIKIGVEPLALWKLTGLVSESLLGKSNLKWEIAERLDDGRDIIANGTLIINVSAPSVLDYDNAPISRYITQIVRLNDQTTKDAPVFRIRPALYSEKPSVPVFSILPTVSPKVAVVGATFTASDGTATDTTNYTRRWLLSGAAIGTASTIVPVTTGNLVLEVTATGSGGSTVATSVASTVAAKLTITGTPPRAVRDATFSFVPTVSGGAGTKVFSLTGTLPAGLSFSTATGAISGTPTTFTISTVSITITDDTGSATLESITIGATVSSDLMARARRVMNSAGTVTAIDQVASQVATITVGAAAGNSTLDSSATFGSGKTYLATDATRFEQVAGWLQNYSGKAIAGRGRIGNVTTGARGSTFGNGIRFRYSGRKFEFSQSGAGYCAIYVTDPATGVRQRATSNDFTSGTNVFVLVDFGSAADRIIEIYAQGSQIWSGLVPENGLDFTLPPARPNKPKIALLWDSWGAGQITPPSGQTAALTNTKIGLGTLMGTALGDENIWCSCIGGTGHLFGSPSWPPTSSATGGGYIDRTNPTVAPSGTDAAGNPMPFWGDFDIALMGDRDLLIQHCSINDVPGTNKPSDAQHQEAVRLETVALMAKQPNAIIVGLGPQGTFNGTAGVSPTQSRYDACRAGFVAAAGSDPRMIWVDISPTGAAVYSNTTRNAANVGSDNLHPNDAGARVYAALEAQAILAALNARFN